MLQMINVSSGYGSKPILQNINFEIFENEILALIGLNGSGKSTLLKTLVGLLKLKAGDVLYQKKPLFAYSLRERARIVNLLESESRAYFPITIAELLRVGRDHSESQELAQREEAALEAVGLAGYKHRNILELSSGEAQRAFVAHALTSPSQIIMMDEPLSHLDWAHQTQLVENLKKWKKKFPTTFVIALHQLDRVVELADRVALIHKGQILKIGTPKDVFEADITGETFAFKSLIDENPLDGWPRLNLGRKE